jgi:hypothetical protein
MAFGTDIAACPWTYNSMLGTTSYWQLSSILTPMPHSLDTYSDMRIWLHGRWCTIVTLHWLKHSESHHQSATLDFQQFQIHKTQQTWFPRWGYYKLVLEGWKESTHKGSTELIEHPVAWGIEPFQVLLQTSSLQIPHHASNIRSETFLSAHWRFMILTNF